LKLEIIFFFYFYIYNNIIKIYYNKYFYNHILLFMSFWKMLKKKNKVLQIKILLGINVISNVTLIGNANLL